MSGSRVSTVLLACIAAAASGTPAQGGEPALIAFPEGASALAILYRGEPYVEFQLVGWGAKWAWMGFEGTARAEGDEAVLECAGRHAGADLKAMLRIRKTGARQLTIDATLSTTKDVELTCIAAALNVAGPRFAKGRVDVTRADGATQVVPLPLEKRGLGDAVRTASWVDLEGCRTVVTLDPPRHIPSDGAARIVLAAGAFKAGEPSKTSFVIDLPVDLAWYASVDRIPPEPGTDAWYPFRPGAVDGAPSELGMEDWLDAPAGKHGRILRKDDVLICGGRPVKLWGLNLCYAACAPEKELADRRAAFYARHGVNAVRLHKWADGPGWAGIQSDASCVAFDPATLDRMDYQVAQLKKAGIYVKLSAHFGTLKLGPADKPLVPYLEEFAPVKGPRARFETPHSAVFYAPELQDVQILQMVNLLKHRNPHSGLTYAEEPAIAFIEIINEQSILFYTSMNPLKASATIRRQAGKRFCDWLRAKYGSAEKLAEAWGPGVLDCFRNEGFTDPERLESDTILPLGNPWYWDPAQLAGSQAAKRRRLLDTAVFLYELQCAFYDRYVKAVREAGYTGEIVASNWQAGRGVSHYLNLHSDWRVGTIDRHNYFGGGDRYRIANATLLATPGSGLLSTGLQQVADRPFMLSEWIHVTPNEWGVEGPAVIGAYGMGLQGWDVSYMFQNKDSGTFSERIGQERWDVAAPNVMGVFPAVSRQVLRGDVRESGVCAVRNVHLPSLKEGTVGFEDTVVQDYDVKSFSSDRVPSRALASVRCVVAFTETREKTPVFDLAPFETDGWITSSTGQLRWRPGRTKLDGVFTMDTPGTKAVVGFAGGESFSLGCVRIDPASRYAAVYVTAKEKDRSIETSSRLLVVAIARARNSGMRVLADERILDAGKPPVVMEPVKARIAIRKSGTPKVFLLDHDGRKTDKTLTVTDGVFEIDGARDRTPYYLVVYPD